MSASRKTLGLAVLVTVVLVVSSLGLMSVVHGTGGLASPAPKASAVSPLTTKSTGSGPATLSAGTSASMTGSPISRPLPAPPAPLDQNLPTGGSGTSPAGSHILSTLGAKGVPERDIELPYLLESPTRALTNGHVNLTYTSSPSPYGIGDFGLKNVSGVVTPYRLSTPSVEANFSTNYLAGYSGGLSSTDEWGVQLNAVLNNVTLFGTTGYQFWTQNVFEYSPSLQSLVFVSNIWNFSSSAVALSCNAFYQAGGNNECPEFYYAQTGYIPATEPFHLQLYLNSTLIGGRDAVFFNYSLTSGLGTSSASFDYAIFNSLAAGGNPASTPAPVYIANGFNYNPVGLPDDFEITLGGPGGGSNFDVFESDATYMSLQYYDTTDSTYLTVPSAYNVGGETGETSVGVNAAWTQFSGGKFPLGCLACVTLSNGPSFQYGLWGVGGVGVGGYSPTVPETDWASQSDIASVLHPSNGFLFIAEGKVFTSWTMNWSKFQWSPDFRPFQYFNNLPIGNYTLVQVAAEYGASYGEFYISSDGQYQTFSPAPAKDTTTGVYTPLWAFNQTGLQNISSGTDSYGNYILYNNQLAPLGQDPSSADFCPSSCADFPWFGLVNDFGFPVFPGILLSDVIGVDVFSAASFYVNAPGAPTQVQQAIQHFGWPETNDLQMFFWDDQDINLEGSTIGGWWPATSDFGVSSSFASVVFWNTSYSVISTNTFNVGGMGLFLYGGIFNTIGNNTFLSASAPVEANPDATAAAYYGSVGLVDADFGDAEQYGASARNTCDVCDTVYNNIFDTVITATSPYYDPYTGNYPNQYPYDFSEAWNIPYTPGVTNIIGGDYLGGNYYWDYGYGENPYGVLPDVELNYLPEYEFDSPPAYIGGEYGLGGDYYPLVTVPLYQVTFKEVGLPAGVEWDVDVAIPPPYYFEDYDAENYTTAPLEMNFTESQGTWEYYPYSDDKYYSPSSYYGYFTVNSTTGNIVVTVHFEAAYVLTVHESGLPSGTYWYAETYNASTGYHVNYTHTGSSNTVFELITGTYEWWAETYSANSGQYDMVPGDQTDVTITANTTVDVAFVPVFHVDVHAVGLPAGTQWFFTLRNSTESYNYWYSNTGVWNNFSAAGIGYIFTATSAGYVPQNGTLKLSANTTLTVTFAAAAGLTFSESGLPSGAMWTVSLTQGTQVTTLSGTASSIVFDTSVGAYSYTVSATGYAATPSSGNGTLSANSLVSVTFAVATGTLSGTVSPSGATLWVDGTQETLGSGGTYSLTLPVGLHSVEVTASGYATYYNNATTTQGKTTTLNIALTAISSSSSSGAAGISTTAWVLIAVLGALAAIFLVTTIIFSRRGRQPPAVTPYASSPAGAEPAGAPPPWQEPPPSPPTGST